MKSIDNKEIKDIIFPDDIWDKFKKAAPHFESSKKEYIRFAPTWLTEQTLNIYEQMTGKKMSNRDLSCAHCVLSIYKVASKLYFQELDRRNKLEEENKDVITETNAEPNKRDKKKKVGSDGNGKKRGIEDKN